MEYRRVPWIVMCLTLASWVKLPTLCFGADFRSEIVYLVMLDRFSNGDSRDDGQPAAAIRCHLHDR